MPLYEIEHSIPLSKSERDELAQTITQIHTRKFTTPSLFVNVKFVDIQSQHTYVAGKELTLPRTSGASTASWRMFMLAAHAQDSREDFEETTLSIVEAWNRIVNGGQPAGKDRELNRVFVMGAISAGWENGFLLPKAGDDAQWLASNAPRFEELAQQGDEDFVELVAEMRNREDFIR